MPQEILGDQDKVLPPLPGLAPQSCCSPRHRPTTSLHVAYRWPLPTAPTAARLPSPLPLRDPYLLVVLLVDLPVALAARVLGARDELLGAGQRIQDVLGRGQESGVRGQGSDGAG